MNALKRHVDSSLQKLETTSAEHQAAALEKLEKNLETKSAEHQAALIEVQKQNAELVRQNSKMLKMLKGLRSKTWSLGVFRPKSETVSQMYSSAVSIAEERGCAEPIVQQWIPEHKFEEYKTTNKHKIGIG